MYHAATVTASAAVSTAAKGVRTTRRGRRPESVLAPLWVFAIVLAILVVAAALPTAAEGARASTSSRRVRVEASDTLWSIARANPVAGLTTAQSVAAMRRLNGFGDDATLQPGEVVTIPSEPTFASNLAMR